MFAVEVVHKSIQNGKIKQIQVHFVVWIRMEGRTYFLAVTSIVETQGFPS